MTDKLSTSPTANMLALQQLRELTGTDVGDFNALNFDHLLALFRTQYTRGWNASRNDTNLTVTTEAMLLGYGDYSVGLPKWTALAETGILG